MNWTKQPLGALELLPNSSSNQETGNEPKPELMARSSFAALGIQHFTNTAV